MADSGATLLEVLMGLAPKPTNKEAKNVSGPLPELLTLEGEKPPGWKVVRTKKMSGVDLKSHTMYAPFESSAYALKQRVHEIGHAALTPEVDLKKEADKAGVPLLMLESLEDARIHSFLMEDEDLAAMLDGGTFDAESEKIKQLEIGLPRWTQRLSQDEKLALGASLYLSCANTQNEEVGKRLAHACGVPLPPLQAAAEKVKGKAFGELPGVLQQLWKELHPPSMKKPDESEGEGPPGGSGDPGGDKEKKSSSGPPPVSSGSGSKPPPPKAEEKSKPKEAPKPPPPPPDMSTTQSWRDQSVFAPIIAPSQDALEQDAMGDGEGEGDGDSYSEEFSGYNFNTMAQGVIDSGKKLRLEDYMDIDARWGNMAFEELPMPVALKRPRKHPVRTPRHRDDGGNLGAIHRLRIDGKVFRRKQVERAKKRIGTLLLDGSGSMRISAEEIEMMLELAPQATIAMYSGYGGTIEHQGKLWVLAKKRRRCHSDVVQGPSGWSLEGKTAGNVVDGPALRWLATQPGPRIWVSDGGVTGVGDTPGRSLHDDVRDIMAAARIVQVPSIPVLFSKAEDLSQSYIKLADIVR